jgi:hypothetical protein
MRAGMPDGKPKRLLILGGLAIAVLAAIPLLRRLSPEDNRVRWSNMVWVPAQVNGRTEPHAALMVETELEGLRMRGLMQLDLGIDPTVVYGAVRAAGDSVTINGTIANRHFQNERFYFRPSAGAPAPATKPPLLGSIGAGFFEHRILILDFVKQRLAILGKGAVLAPALDRGIEYLPLRFQNGHVLVAAAIDGREVPNALFDTGSSMIPFFASRGRWSEWTHRQTGDSANSTIRLQSWGKEAVVVGAPVGTLCVGSACLSHPEIYCQSSRLPNLDFDKAPQLSGAFGNAIFLGRYTVIVDIPGRRFGLIHGSFDASGE